MGGEVDALVPFDFPSVSADRDVTERSEPPATIGENDANDPGGTWFAINGWLSWALGTLDGIVPDARAASSIHSSRWARGMRRRERTEDRKRNLSVAQCRHAIPVPLGGEAHRLGELLQRDRLLPAQVGGLAQDGLRHRRDVVG